MSSQGNFVGGNKPWPGKGETYDSYERSVMGYKPPSDKPRYRSYREQLESCELDKVIANSNLPIHKADNGKDYPIVEYYYHVVEIVITGKPAGGAWGKREWRAPYREIECELCSKGQAHLCKSYQDGIDKEREKEPKL